MFALLDLVKKKTREEFTDVLLSVASALGLSVTAWQEGGWTRTIIALLAQQAANFTEIIIEPIKGGFGDLLSSDDWADQWALGFYNETRVAAVAAKTDLFVATNSTATAHPLADGEGIWAHNTSGKLYRNKGAVTIQPNTTTTFTVEAVEAGSASSAAQNTVQTLVSPSMPGVTFTHPAMLGTDKETTAALIPRSRSKLTSLSANGPKGIYDYIATTPKYNPTTVPITRSKTTANETTGAVTVYVATGAGAPSGGDVTTTTASLDKWAEPWCVTATAVGASANTINITSTVTLKGSNLTVAQVQAAVLAALTTYFANLPIGGIEIPPAAGKVYVSNLIVVIANATPGVIGVTVTLPAADVAIATNEVPVLGAVTTNVTLL